MKSINIFISILLVALFLAACGSTSTDESSQVSATKSAQEGGQPGEDGADGSEANVKSEGSDSDPSLPAKQTTQEPGFDREMPLVMTLALGTFKLEQSGYPLDADQSAEMLVLWKAARSLSESDTTAVEELDAVIKQIQGLLTGEQLAEIEGMDLSF